MFISPKCTTRTILVCSAISITALLFSLTQWHMLSAGAAAPALNTLTVHSASAESTFRAGVSLVTSMALSWSPTGNLATARYLHTATLLPNGKVLVAGGQGNNGFPNITELYDPATEIWNLTSNLTTGRYFHTATLLPNGKVLVVGGNNGDSLASAELYDPALGTWSQTGSLAIARDRHTATLLPNGKVLVAGGYSTNSIQASAELYDPALETWTATGGFVTARTQHTATLLPNGKVLVAGGRGNSGYPNSAELYDPAIGIWTATANLAIARVSHTMTLLPNGKVLVAGGHDGSFNMSSSELYDPATATWSPTGNLATARYLHTATLLPNGNVIVAGGINSISGILSSSEPYDPAAEMWGTYGNLNTARYLHTATLLQNGRVLIAGGIAISGYLSSAEITEAVNQAPTIMGATLSRQAGTPASPSQIATVGDAEDAEDTLNVTTTPLSGSGITLSGISTDSGGNITANVGAVCNATTSIFTLRVTDSGGLFAEAMLTVNVVDTSAPMLTLKPNLELWPPNHKYQTVTMSQMVASVSDGCNTGLNISSVVIEKVTSDEPDDSSGDGKTVNDIMIAADCRSVQLRAERAGGGNGRVYVVTLRVRDASGNTTRKGFKVSVPHDQKVPAVQDATVQTKTSGCP
jgi:hypothetical protein